VQAGSSLEVTARPRSRYVADFVGVNWLRGRALDGAVTLSDGGTLTVPDVDIGEVFVVIHPRAVALHRQKPRAVPATCSAAPSSPSTTRARGCASA
jgi:molybdate transport system ATP-binding protein